MRVPVDERRAVETLLALLRLEGLSGRERPVADAVRRRLLEAGCAPDWIREDAAAQRLGPGFETGNLIVRIPGRRRGPRRMFCGHMDKVPLCRGAVPVLRDGRIRPAGATALGADNRTAVGCLVTLVETLLRERPPHPPLTVLFTVGEENGLNGAKAVRPRNLGLPAMAFNIDGGRPGGIVVAAVGAIRWTADVKGRSAHAGAHPEDGISAILIAARAIERIAARGYFGAIRQGARRGTANVGVIEGGEATNQVTDRVRLRGECRSHRAAFLRRIEREHAQALAWAARSVRNAAGQHGATDFRSEADYEAFRLPRRAPVVRLALSAARALGLEAAAECTNGGLDANPLNAKGIPTVTLGAGQHGAHSTDEYADVAEYLDGCRLALALATRD